MLRRILGCLQGVASADLSAPLPLPSRWYLYANCTTSDPKVTLAWQISIDPTFNASSTIAASTGTLAGNTTPRMLARKLLQQDANTNSSMLPMLLSEEVSLGRTVLPHLMQFMPMNGATGGNLLNYLAGTVTPVSATTSIDITHLLRARGVADLNPAPMDPNDLSLGPSVFPFSSTQVSAQCQNYYDGTPLQCQCQTQVSWVIAEAGAFINYVGAVPA